MAELVIDPEKMRRGVDNFVLRLRRPGRIKRAVETPVRQRTAEQAALVALGRLIADGVF